ncbi:hypothetical protein STSP2_01084 [Anaerohalosphaera lusitana]|uniref:HTH HARE-type domain-containing protein n=1 Tax=Anaerohalosphaera lusitana TaxID=1936003 RepID=A0A1U9NJ19_9BACT|nr:winged helix-turn-helix domain-containing protein [Anaerohalosphaera lusitana]AQT67932.1 hypothetical protein STSP2_01084 [Anaerohalosphaera lusitana]
MKANQLKPGTICSCKVGSNTTQVKLLEAEPKGGWKVESLTSGKTMTIRNADRLEPADTAEKSSKADKSPASKTKGHTGGPKGSEAKRESKRLSLLDSAAVILEVISPLSCKDIVEKAIETNIWQPKSGKTPANTLYASILREINTKGDDSRFRRAQERGKFELVN